MAINEVSNNQTPAVQGTNSGDGSGVVGTSKTWQGVYGESQTNAGVAGTGKTQGSWGVYGTSDDGVGVAGISKSWQGVYGESETNAGVAGTGKAQGSWGVYGTSDDGVGVAGISKSWQGVYGESETNVGVVGVSSQNVGVWAESKTDGQPGLHAIGTDIAARFDGDVEVTGDVRLVGANDCAELVEWSDSQPPVAGSVAVLGPQGTLGLCRVPYDRAVAGVISGAGDFRPGLVLGRVDSDATAACLALVGRSYCRVDASYGPIRIGDLITTSPTPGHGMVARSRRRSFGSTIGKACAPVVSGRGLIPVLLALQ